MPTTVIACDSIVPIDAIGTIESLAAGTLSEEDLATWFRAGRSLEGVDTWRRIFGDGVLRMYNQIPTPSVLTTPTEASRRSLNPGMDEDYWGFGNVRD